MTGRDTDHHPAWRIIFALAAIYNIAFGAWAVFQPEEFFRRFDLGQPNHPWVWSCLGMVIGVYGLGYAYAAWRPERGDVIVALGLLGKILGPIEWLWTVQNGEIPSRTFPLILANDLIWWYPFAAYLLRGARRPRMIIALIVAGFHAAACLALLSVRQGTEAAPAIVDRMSFIREEAAAWTLCWFLWTGASLGLLAFITSWILRLRELGAGIVPLMLGFTACAIGLCFDLASEIVAIVRLTDLQLDQSAFALWARRMSLLGAGLGNGFYCVGGLVLSFVSWRIAFQRGAKALLACGVWVSGLMLSAAAFADQPGLMVACGGILMAFFIPWAILTGLCLDEAAVHE